MLRHTWYLYKGQVRGNGICRCHDFFSPLFQAAEETTEKIVRFLIILYLKMLWQVESCIDKIRCLWSDKIVIYIYERSAWLRRSVHLSRFLLFDSQLLSFHEASTEKCWLFHAWKFLTLLLIIFVDGGRNEILFLISNALCAFVLWSSDVDLWT